MYFANLLSCTPAGDAGFAEDILQPTTANEPLPSASVEDQLLLLLGVVLKEGHREAEVKGGEEPFQV